MKATNSLNVRGDFSVVSSINGVSNVHSKRSQSAFVVIGKLSYSRAFTSVQSRRLDILRPENKQIDPGDTEKAF